MPDTGSGGAGPAASLEGPLWRLQTTVDDHGSRADVPADIVATARFTKGRVSGSGGCNRYNGGYVRDGASLAIGPIASTMRACFDPAGTVEASFFEALSRVTAFTVADDRLELLDAVGAPVILLSLVAEATLVGTTWGATGVNNGRGGVVSLVAETELTARFADDGSLAGSSGCNRYRGSLTVDGSRIAIGPLATTRMACEEAVSAQEAMFLAALQRATVYRIDDDTLELRDDDGALQVSFRTTTQAAEV